MQAQAKSIEFVLFAPPGEGASARSVLRRFTLTLLRSHPHAHNSPAESYRASSASHPGLVGRGPLMLSPVIPSHRPLPALGFLVDPRGSETRIPPIHH